ESFDFAGAVVGLMVAAAGAPALVPRLAALGVSSVAAFPIALATVLVLALVVARLLGAALARAVHALSLGGLDRTGGVLFGAFKGAACLGLVLMLLQRLVPSPAVQMAIQESLLGPTLMRVATGALEMGREISAAGRV